MPTRPMAVLELQTAVQYRLLADTTLMAMITGVFDAAPERQAPPYITYGDHISEPFATFGHWNARVTFMLDIWSEATGKEECYRILSEVVRILVTTPTNPPLTLTDYGQAGMHFDWSTTIYESDFALWHMPARFISYMGEQ
jgi:uncharacterized protein DUF3168